MCTYEYHLLMETRVLLIGYCSPAMLSPFHPHSHTIITRTTHTAQEREKRSDGWSPRFFTLDENEEEFPGEVEGKECPHWKWNGEYFKIKDRGPSSEGAWSSECCGLFVCGMADSVGCV